MHKTFPSFTLLAALFSLLGCASGEELCLGDAVACELRTADQCDSGCSLTRGCVGGAISCESLTDEGPQLCNQTSGCTWSGLCEGVEGCRQRSYDECEAMEGCNQVRFCFGDGTRCEALEDSQCGLYPQCGNESVCQGAAMACEDIGSRPQCARVPGCFPAETTPSVVDD